MRVERDTVGARGVNSKDTANDLPDSSGLDGIFLGGMLVLGGRRRKHEDGCSLGANQKRTLWTATTLGMALAACAAFVTVCEDMMSRMVLRVRN